MSSAVDPVTVYDLLDERVVRLGSGVAQADGDPDRQRALGIRATQSLGLRPEHDTRELRAQYRAVVVR
jgi:hypothetical protein